MKFARYLEDSQIPEWKKKYIDFKGLKKLISAIRRAKELNASALSFSSQSQAGAQSLLSQSPQGSPQVGRRGKRPSFSSPQRNYGSTDPTLFPQGTSGDGIRGVPPLELPPPVSSPSYGLSQNRARISTTAFQEYPRPLQRSQTDIGVAEGVHKRTPTLMPSLRGLRNRSSTWRLSRNPKFKTYGSLAEVYEQVGPLELQFFDKLDQEAHKVEAFYVDRESVARSRLVVLRDQLKELRGHRKIYHALHQAQPGSGNWMEYVTQRVPLPTWSHARTDGHTEAMPGSPTGPLQTSTHNDPDDYYYAKKRLKTALLEFYRGLELLNDYRVLNETGFRKALKKFDKYTRNVTRELYVQAKIDPLHFTHKRAVSDMMTEVEQLYAEFFESGNLKRARDRLRQTARVTSHYGSTFRSGIFLGLALPALIVGLRNALASDVHHKVPEWSPLLQAYGALFIPSAFSVLITLNVITWARARVNYVFIFELDLRTVTDSRRYAELPSFLFFTLCYAFFFSFSNVWIPTAWPLLWMAFTLVFLLDPIPLFSKTSRYWLLRLSARLLASGTRRVEFADFWLGDQFCSLVYTLTSMYFIACAATVDGGWTNAIPRCETRNNRHWPLLFFLASFPSIVRAVQCVRRWVDEGKRMHLVNGGKYLSSMVMYLFYFWWRFHGSARNGYMAVWMLSATIASLYTTYWDLVMDWSVFSQSWPPEWLKREVIYRNHIWIYPIATIINVILRFAWTIYIPARGPSAPLRGFIAGCLEALRRVQWNMIRLENEQVGNADQFRVTREVPLPYRFNPEDDSEDEPLSHDSKLRRRKQQRARDSVVRLSGLQAMEEGDHSEPDGTEQHQAGS